jgi:hypothetical protein
MSDIPFENTTDPVAGEPVAELAQLREEPSPEFLGHVLDGINARQTSTQALEMHWWGITQLIGEIADTLFRALGLREDSPGDE